mmetsp:Transcript_18698/g.30314  ORF Transcript_18698/g.30314 Transcript_18698/m.30314 type:complete len:176 (+) Transcript_18698:65-592(+)
MPVSVAMMGAVVNARMRFNAMAFRSRRRMKEYGGCSSRAFSPNGCDNLMHPRQCTASVMFGLLLVTMTVLVVTIAAIGVQRILEALLLPECLADLSGTLLLVWFALRSHAISEQASKAWHSTIGAAYSMCLDGCAHLLGSNSSLFLMTEESTPKHLKRRRGGESTTLEVKRQRIV